MTGPSIAVIDPKSMMVEKSYALDCQALAGTTSASITGIALGAFQHLLVSACGFPIVLNALTGHVFNVIKQVGGGDEVWHNPGDGRFYVTGLDTSTPPVQSVGVIDAETSTWLQNVPNVRGKNPAAFAETNHTFTIQAKNNTERFRPQLRQLLGIAEMIFDPPEPAAVSIRRMRVPSEATMSLSPLCPALPPPSFNLTVPGFRSSSSCAIRISSGAMR